MSTDTGTIALRIMTIMPLLHPFLPVGGAGRATTACGTSYARNEAQCRSMSARNRARVKPCTSFGTAVVIALIDEPDGPKLAVSVIDDGAGLPPGFDPTRSDRLGLQIVRTLADADLHTFQTDHRDAVHEMRRADAAHTD